MLKKMLLTQWIIFQSIILFSQELAIIQDQRTYPASWISHPTASPTDYGVFHFRKTVQFDKIPATLPINVTADNRYILYINGKNISYGPARGDLSNWYFETIDIAEYLKPGQNTLSAVVWNMGAHAPLAQYTSKTAFLLWSDSPEYSQLNTGDSWKVMQNEAITPVPVNIRGFYAAGSGDRVDGSKYPWGWEKPGYDDSSWLEAFVVWKAVKKGYLFGDYWQLVPRVIPLMEEKPEIPLVIRKTENIAIPSGKYDFKKPIIIPANQKVTIYFDQTHLTTGYPVLNVSKGKNAIISATYAEAAFDSPSGTTGPLEFAKSDRNIIEGKHFEGTQDIFIADGSDNRVFQPLWMRCWRFIKMDIETKDEELILRDYHGIFWAYPFEQIAFFKSDLPALEKIWDVSWRTARLCAGETYFDCPFYEQLQYVGDTRIQSLISMYITGDDRLMKQAIQQLDYSRFDEGLTHSRYPSSIRQVIPPFSLYWISMIYDHWMHKADTSFIRQFLPGIESVIAWFERHIDETGMPGHFNDWWFFADWAKEFEAGVPKGAYSSQSSIISLHFAYTLQHASVIMKACNYPERAERYTHLANSVKSAVMKHCFNADKQLIAQTPAQDQYSQHSTIFGVLTDAIPISQQKETLKRILTEPGLIKCTIYYQFYLFQALKKVGLADIYLDQLGDWDAMLAQNLTTFAEEAVNPRSDCHAWSASPMYDYLATVCGIRPISPGFKSFTIEPAFGKLQMMEAKMPTPYGFIYLDLKGTGKSGISGKIEIPTGTEAHFSWDGKVSIYKEGTHELK